MVTMNVTLDSFLYWQLWTTFNENKKRNFLSELLLGMRLGCHTTCDSVRLICAIKVFWIFMRPTVDLTLLSWISDFCAYVLHYLIRIIVSFFIGSLNSSQYVMKARFQVLSRSRLQMCVVDPMDHLIID